MSDIISQITECDKSLALLRESWLDARPEKKARWLGLINQSLDSRLVLMKRRDKAKQGSTP